MGHQLFVDKDVECAKIVLKAMMLMGLNGNTNVCKDIGRQLLTYDQRLTPAKIFLRIKELTVDNVRVAMHGVFHNRDHAMVAVGGIKGLPSHKWIRNNSY
jgi:processing peptidase subunit beta